MTLSEWINNIRWKYFTNNKSGLIFKETTKEFRIVHKMTENKRYNIKPSKIIENGFCIQDDEKEHSFPTVDDKSHLIMYEKGLNEQDNRIKELETVMRQILYETRANYTKGEYSVTVSISPQMHDKLTELITEVK